VRNCEILGVLGEGSFGSVLMMREPNTGKEYALKVVRKEQMRAENQEEMMRSERDLMMLLDCEFIVRLYRAYEDNEFVALLLEVCFGGELYDVYSENDIYGDEAHARFYLASVALGLLHLHNKRIVWRDLKLENLLIDCKGYLKLTDMGIAKMVLGVTYTICGTADYFAPETLRQSGHNRAVDWWACGVLTFIMMTGFAPFDAPDNASIYRNIVKGITKVNFPKSMSPESVEVVKALCKKKPNDRLPMQRGGASKFMDLPFFKGLSFDDLGMKKVDAPFVPQPFDKSTVEKRELSRPLNLDYKELSDWND
jgi:serine/threonine protein kinase